MDTFTMDRYLYYKHLPEYYLIRKENRFMAMRDEIREQHKKMEGRSRKEKLEYFWEYYKVHTLIVLTAILFTVIFVRDILSSKEEAFAAVFLNAYGHTSQSEFQADFAAYAGIDTEQYACNLDTSSTLSLDIMSEINIAVAQRMVAMAQSGKLDMLAADPVIFAYYAQGGLLSDLREELSPEEIAYYRDSLYYIDRAASQTDTAAADSSTGPVSASADPSSMQDPVPVGICLTDNQMLQKWGCYTADTQPPIIGFVSSSQRKELCHLLLAYLEE